MGKTGSLRGECCVPQMTVRDLCLIEVLRDHHRTVTGPISPEDFEGSYKGVVRDVDPSGSLWGVTATFADPRITKHPRGTIAVLDDREPPFPYRVVPRYRMQGMTTHGKFELGDECVIVIGDFTTDDGLCGNAGMDIPEIRRLCSASLTGVWKARVIQPMNSGFDLGGRTYYAVAAALADERIVEHTDPRVSDWMGLELPMRYQVWENDLTAQSALAIAEGWNAMRRFASESLKTLRKEARDIKKDWNI